MPARRWRRSLVCRRARCRWRERWRLAELRLRFDRGGRLRSAILRAEILHAARAAAAGAKGTGGARVLHELIAGATAEERRALRLPSSTKHCACTKHGASVGRSSAQHAAAFGDLRRALGRLGMSAAEQLALWRLLAAQINLCELAADAKDDTPVAERPAGPLGAAAAQLGVGADELAAALGGGKQAVRARCALCAFAHHAACAALIAAANRDATRRHRRHRRQRRRDGASGCQNGLGSARL